MTWKQLIERDCREWKLSTIDPHDRDTLEIWCEICHACSKPVTWKGAHCCGYFPLFLHVNKKLDDDDDIDESNCLGSFKMSKKG